MDTMFPKKHMVSKKVTNMMDLGMDEANDEEAKLDQDSSSKYRLREKAKSHKKKKAAKHGDDSKISHMGQLSPTKKKNLPVHAGKSKTHHMLSTHMFSSSHAEDDDDESSNTHMLTPPKLHAPTLPHRQHKQAREVPHAPTLPHVDIKRKDVKKAAPKRPSMH